ncbi:MAG: WYL domain-containing protein [Oscillospiraceae bacterium]|nr:WYL domain-containing protein [Oscillospiraceae bacterium]
MAETKSRILYILKYLWHNTDAEHYATTGDILTYLKENGISCDRKTIPGDIAKLCNIGIDIEEERSRENRYSLSSHLFTLPEVKLLIDAVESSKFITAKKSSELANKLSQMTSVYQSEGLKRNIYISQRVKPMNEQIYYLVDNINTAINQGKQISFLYFHYNQYREEVPNNNGKRYHFSPYYLVWNEDHYYVVGFCEKHQRITTFRVDRMKSINILCSDAVPQPKDFNLPDFTRQVFDMYDGTKEKVTLKITE